MSSFASQVVGLGSAASAAKRMANTDAGEAAYVAALSQEFKHGDANLARQGIVNLSQSGWSDASSSTQERNLNIGFR